MAAKKTSKAKTTRKPKTETEQAQANLDEALIEKKPAKAKKLVKQKTPQEELYDVVQAYETGKEIGQAAVDTPVIGLAIVFGAGLAMWGRYKQSQAEQNED